jgi:penicillin-binding protein 2
LISQVRIKDHWAEQRIFLRRSLAAGVVMLALVLALLGKLVQLQIVRHDYYADLSQGNRVRIEPIPPNRGLILDRNGTVLAENLPAYQLELTPEQVPDIDAALRSLMGLGLLVPEDVTRLKRLIRSRRSFEAVPIRLQLTDEEVARFAVHRHDFPGIDIQTRLTRFYPHGALGVHALGYVAAISEQDMAKIDQGEYAGTTLIGKIGIEASFEKELHGAPGFRQVLVNAQGRPVELTGQLQSELSSQSSMAGNDLLLSLDLRVQQAAEDALKGLRGAVVAIDPANGDVLAFASTPGFDPNPFGRGLTTAEYAALQNDIDRPLFNRALRGVYPPGSTIKPVVALAALDSATVDPAQTRYCKGFFTLPGSRHRYRDWRPEGHGWVNLHEAIAESCDTYFYSVAQNLGIDKMSQFLSRFGLGRATGIDIDGEKTGLVPSREWKQRAFSRAEDRVWFPGDTVIIGIGQGYMLATPLQLAHMASTIGGRGKSFEPRLVSAVRDARTGQVRKLAPQPSPGVEGVDPARWQRIIDGMVGVTSPPKGTARGSAAGAKYSIAGKTGTAQVFSVGQTEKYDEKTVEERLRDHALFVAFAPADAPRIALSVLVENGRSGSGTAAPVARKVMDAYLVDPASAATQVSKAAAPTSAPRSTTAARSTTTSTIPPASTSPSTPSATPPGERASEPASAPPSTSPGEPPSTAPSAPESPTPLPEVPEQPASPTPETEEPASPPPVPEE